MYCTRFLIAVALMSLAGSAFGQSLLFRVNGSAGGDRLAESVGNAGDFNRDGYDDFIVGAMWNDQGGASAGIARVHSG